MPVYYRKTQDNRKNSTHKGQWYGRAVYQGTVNEYDLAKSIEAKCTVHRADVVAVIIALIDEMTRALQSSQRVKLTGFGTFKMGMSTRPAKTIEKFTADNIRKLRVLFQPETKIAQDGSRTRTMITGARVKEWGGFAPSAAPGSSTTSGSGSTTGGSTTGGSSSQSGSGTQSGSGSQSGSGTQSGSGNQSGSGTQSDSGNQSGDKGDTGEDF